jgi:penicillin-insensitive murein DD-endopeptidase
VGLRSFCAVLILAATVSACASLGVVGDGTAASIGFTNSGRLRDAAQIPNEGPGFWAPPLWKARGRRFAVNELVGLVAEAGQRVVDVYPGSRIGVGDLSRPQGGQSVHHRSHQNGRDVDLLLFARDGNGTPVTLTQMTSFWRGRSRNGLEFDVPRNWEMVKAMLESKIARVQYIFLNEQLAELLLAYAFVRGESADLTERARLVIRQPGDSASHNDHMHVRIYCPLGDVAVGCEDTEYPEEVKMQQLLVASAFDESTVMLRAARPMPPMVALLGFLAR